MALGPTPRTSKAQWKKEGYFTSCKSAWAVLPLARAAVTKSPKLMAYTTEMSHVTVWRPKVQGQRRFLPGWEGESAPPSPLASGARWHLWGSLACIHTAPSHQHLTGSRAHPNTDDLISDDILANPISQSKALGIRNSILMK